MRHPLSRFTFVLMLTAAFAPVLSAAVPKIAVVLKAHAPFWAAVEKGANEAAARLGAEITVKSPLKETDVSVQIQLLNAAVAQGVDAVVIAACNKEALAVPLASAAVKGVKIVAIDTPLAPNVAPVFVGTDQEAAGRAAGKLLSQIVSDTAEVAILKNQQGSGASTAREVGALATFRETHPKNTVHGDIYASSEPGAEIAKCELLLSSHPQIAAVLSSSTPGTLAMLKVLQEKKLTGSIKLIGFGFNLSPEIAAALESGALHGWIAQQPTQFGLHGIEAAVALIKGETVPAVVRTEFVVITKENLAEPAVQALLQL